MKEIRAMVNSMKVILSIVVVDYKRHGYGTLYSPNGSVVAEADGQMTNLLAQGNKVINKVYF